MQEAVAMALFAVLGDLAFAERKQGRNELETNGLFRGSSRKPKKMGGNAIESLDDPEIIQIPPLHAVKER